MAALLLSLSLFACNEGQSDEPAETVPRAELAYDGCVQSSAACADDDESLEAAEGVVADVCNEMVDLFVDQGGDPCLDAMIETYECLPAPSCSEDADDEYQLALETCAERSGALELCPLDELGFGA